MSVSENGKDLQEKKVPALGGYAYPKTSVLLLAVIFVSLITISVNTSELQTTDTAKTLADKDHSNSMNEQ